MKLYIPDPLPNDPNHILDAQDFIGPTNTNTVPEPATVLLLGVGMTGLAFRSRKSLPRRG